MNIAQNPNSELSHFAVNTPQVFEIPETFRETARQFQEAMMQYSCAIREFKTKLEVLNDELSMRNARNPIEMIKARVKKPKSIVEKLQRRGLPLSIESMESNLDDIAGVRVICSFVDDIYEISRMLERQDDVTIIAIKDYIKAPKENGYRSYHMIVEVPVFFSSSKKNIRVEVQTLLSSPSADSAAVVSVLAVCPPQAARDAAIAPASIRAANFFVFLIISSS